MVLRLVSIKTSVPDLSQCLHLADMGVTENTENSLAWIVVTCTFFAIPHTMRYSSSKHKVQKYRKMTYGELLDEAGIKTPARVQLYLKLKKTNITSNCCAQGLTPCILYDFSARKRHMGASVPHIRSSLELHQIQTTPLNNSAPLMTRGGFFTMRSSSAEKNPSGGEPLRLLNPLTNCLPLPAKITTEELYPSSTCS